MVNIYLLYFCEWLHIFSFETLRAVSGSRCTVKSFSVVFFKFDMYFFLRKTWGIIPQWPLLPRNRQIYKLVLVQYPVPLGQSLFQNMKYHKVYVRLFFFLYFFIITNIGFQAKATYTNKAFFVLLLPGLVVCSILDLWIKLKGTIC